MSRNRYFEDLKALAREKREHYRVETARFGLQAVRNIYKAEGIRLDAWPTLPKRIKALYMCEDGDCSVAVQPQLPIEPRLFALVHELKHHYRDQALLQSGALCCGDYNANKDIEVGAEVFAAKFIYPEEEFRRDIATFGARGWTPEELVRFKQHCPAKISYIFLRKRLLRLGLIKTGELEGIKFKKLEEEIYGVPFYRQQWFRRHRAGE